MLVEEVVLDLLTEDLISEGMYFEYKKLDGEFRTRELYAPACDVKRAQCQKRRQKSVRALVLSIEAISNR